MLVLSRKPNQKIVFPTLNITVQVVEIKCGSVRLGIDAPPEVKVRRAEVHDRAAEWGVEKPQVENPVANDGIQERFQRRLLDRLKTTSAGLGVLRLQLDAGLTAEARAALAALHDDFQQLLHGVAGELESPPARPSTPVCKRQKALLVEDDRNERELLAGFLRLSGLDVDTAGDGSDALDYLRSHAKPDVVLLDMGLPQVDGPTMVRELRRDPAYAGMKIFGVTGRLAEEFDLERGPGGIDRWFQKPLDPTAFLHDLTEELENSLCGV